MRTILNAMARPNELSAEPLSHSKVEDGIRMAIDCFSILCSALFQVAGVSPSNQQVDTCRAVAARASSHQIDLPNIIALAWHESGMHIRERSKRGAVGPLQVLPRYWCPKGRKTGCDLILAGIKAYIHYSNASSTFVETVCRYNSGKGCNFSSRSARWARKVDRTAAKIRSKTSNSGCAILGC